MSHASGTGSSTTPGAESLIGGRIGYQDALARYFPELLRVYRGDRSKLWSIDDIHLAYL